MAARDTAELTRVRRQKAFAWAKYYEQVNTAHSNDRVHFRTYSSAAAETSIPAHIKTEFLSMAATLKKRWECPICLGMIEEGDLEITNCGHYYCKGCLTGLQAAARTAHKPKWDCAVCRRQHEFK